MDLSELLRKIYTEDDEKGKTKTKKSNKKSRHELEYQKNRDKFSDPEMDSKNGNQPIKLTRILISFFHIFPETIGPSLNFPTFNV